TALERMATMSPAQSVGKLHQWARVEPRILPHSREVSQHEVPAGGRQTLNDRDSLSGDLRKRGKRLLGKRGEFACVKDAALTAVQVRRLHARPRIHFPAPAEFIHDSW